MILAIKKKRPAIAMIELIFALVIMGIVMVSAPQLISTATQSSYISTQQEAINEAATQVNVIMGYPWDESNTNDTFIDTILHVTNGHDNLEENTSTGLRAGTPTLSNRTFIRGDGERDLNASITITFGVNDGGETIEDDIDDFSGTTSLISVESATVDYIDTININTSIIYNDDNASPNYNNPPIIFNPFGTLTGGGTSNIKEITATLTSTSGVDELNKTIILRAFTCNIGAYEPIGKDF